MHNQVWRRRHSARRRRAATFGDRRWVHARGHEGGEVGRRPSMKEEAHQHPAATPRDTRQVLYRPASHIRLNPLWVSLYRIDWVEPEFRRSGTKSKSAPIPGCRPKPGPTWPPLLNRGQPLDWISDYVKTSTPRSAKLLQAFIWTSIILLCFSMDYQPPSCVLRSEGLLLKLLWDLSFHWELVALKPS
jgi:hypothetical protein